MKYYTYIYFDPSRNNEPIYVGKGSGNRYLHHLNSKKKHPFVQRLQSMKNAGVEPKIEVIWGLEEDIAYQMEVDYISYFGRKDLGKGPLLNLTDGGGKNSGGKLSEEHKKKIGDAHRGRPKPQSLKDKISDKVKTTLSQKPKRQWDTDTKEKISKKLTGIKHSPERIAKAQESKRKKRQERLMLTGSTEPV